MILRDWKKNRSFDDILMMNMLDMECTSGAQNAWKIAFRTMHARCQELQKRLSEVQEENMALRMKQSVEKTDKIMRENAGSDTNTVANLQKKVEELSKQKSQLTHHVFMVAAENRQLWSRLTRLTRTNENLGSQLTKISDTIQQHANSRPSNALTQSFRDVDEDTGKKGCAKYEQIQSAETGNEEPSLEEISLRLINSIMMEKSELEQQCTEMVEMQNGADINLAEVGFTYPEDTNVDSLQQLKQHDLRLSQTKETLADQQVRLKRAIRSLEKMKRGTTCKNCRRNARKTTCQIGTQFDSDDSLKEHGATQTSLPPSASPQAENGIAENVRHAENKSVTSQNICPLCGDYFGPLTTFEVFHEHVINHFAKGRSLESFEVIH